MPIPAATSRAPTPRRPPAGPARSRRRGTRRLAVGRWPRPTRRRRRRPRLASRSRQAERRVRVSAAPAHGVAPLASAVRISAFARRSRPFRVPCGIAEQAGRLARAQPVEDRRPCTAARSSGERRPSAAPRSPYSTPASTWSSASPAARRGVEARPRVRLGRRAPAQPGDEPADARSPRARRPARRRTGSPAPRPADRDRTCRRARRPPPPRRCSAASGGSTASGAWRSNSSRRAASSPPAMARRSVASS